MNNQRTCIAPMLGLSLLVCTLAAEAVETREAPAAGGKKWFPGHYVMLPPDTYSTDNKSFRVLKGADGKLFQGLFMYVTWGQIETSKDAFCWQKIDTLLNGLPRGKKIAFSLSWQGWGGVQACPTDMIDDPVYDGGQRVRGTKSGGGRQLRSGGGFGFPDLDGNITGGHYKSHFRPHVLANSGKWPCWMGVEWQDLMPERTGPKFPDNQIESANLCRTNFIWWITSNRRKDDGYNFDTDVLNYLRAHPNAGITMASPFVGQ